MIRAGAAECGRMALRVSFMVAGWKVPIRGGAGHADGGGAQHEY